MASNNEDPPMPNSTSPGDPSVNKAPNMSPPPVEKSPEVEEVKVPVGKAVYAMIGHGCVYSSGGNIPIPPGMIWIQESECGLYAYSNQVMRFLSPELETFLTTEPMPVTEPEKAKYEFTLRLLSEFRFSVKFPGDTIGNGYNTLFFDHKNVVRPSGIVKLYQDRVFDKILNTEIDTLYPIANKETVEKIYSNSLYPTKEVAWESYFSKGKVPEHLIFNSFLRLPKTYGVDLPEKETEHVILIHAGCRNNCTTGGENLSLPRRAYSSTVEIQRLDSLNASNLLQKDKRGETLLIKYIRAQYFGAAMKLINLLQTRIDVEGMIQYFLVKDEYQKTAIDYIPQLSNSVSGLLPVMLKAIEPIFTKEDSLSKKDLVLSTCSLLSSFTSFGQGRIAMKEIATIGPFVDQMIERYRLSLFEPFVPLLGFLDYQRRYATEELKEIERIKAMPFKIRIAVEPDGSTLLYKYIDENMFSAALYLLQSIRGSVADAGAGADADAVADSALLYTFLKGKKYSTPFESFNDSDITNPLINTIIQEYFKLYLVLLSNRLFTENLDTCKKLLYSINSFIDSPIGSDNTIKKVIQTNLADMVPFLEQIFVVHKLPIVGSILRTLTTIKIPIERTTIASMVQEDLESNRANINYVSDFCTHILKITTVAKGLLAFLKRANTIPIFINLIDSNVMDEIPFATLSPIIQVTSSLLMMFDIPLPIEPYLKVLVSSIEKSGPRALLRSILNHNDRRTTEEILTEIIQYIQAVKPSFPIIIKLLFIIYNYLFPKYIVGPPSIDNSLLASYLMIFNQLAIDPANEFFVRADEFIEKQYPEEPRIVDRIIHAVSQTSQSKELPLLEASLLLVRTLQGITYPAIQAKAAELRTLQSTFEELVRPKPSVGGGRRRTRRRHRSLRR
jgi:hypothetical protein